MKFETLKDNSLRKYLIGAGVAVALLSPLVLNTSLAKYQTSQRIKLAEGKVNYVPYDFKIMAMYQDDGSGNYQEIETMPTSGYIINEEKSYCTLDNKVHDPNAKIYTDDRGKVVIENLSKKDKCYLWFDKVKIPAKDQILAGKQQNIRVDFSTPLTTDTTGTIYKAQDDDGESYYFAGATEDNWVKFAGFYWRIVRINGDGTIRLIYNGPGTVRTGSGTQLATSAFNLSYNNNMYVGYMYTSGQVQGLGTSSTIKGVLESWYQTNIVDKKFDQYVDANAGFCGDRTAYTNTAGTTPGGGTGTTTTYYGAYIRLITNKTPTLKCNIGNISPDLYTKKSSNKGNAQLNQTVGLITADEVAYAGSGYGSAFNNSSYYLYTNQNYWVLSPCDFSYGSARVFYVLSTGYFDVSWVTHEYGIRPVINLRADVKLTGSGLSTDPFVVEP